MKNKRNLRIGLLMLMDCVFMIFSWCAAVALYTYMFQIRGTMIVVLLRYFYLLCLINILVFSFFNVYKNIWLYASVPDMLRIVAASAISNFLIYIVYKLIGGYWQSPAIAMLAFFLLVTMSGGVRLFPRVKRDLSRYIKKTDAMATRVLIVGAGHSASMLIKELSHKVKPYAIVGLIDDDPSKLNMKLNGAKVLGGCEIISEAVVRLQVSEVLIAIPSATNEQLRRIISFCPLNKCTVKLINSINESTQGSDMLRNLDLADLLGREETRLNVNAISSMVDGKTVLITGGGGSIGSEIARQLMAFNLSKLVIFDINENNAYNLYQELLVNFPDKAGAVELRIGSVQDVDRLEHVICEFHPAVVFHAAAYKHVPLMEECPRLAVNNNVFGTYNAAALSLKHGARKFVLISTDKAVNPTNVMGATKRLAERVTISMNALKPYDIKLGKPAVSKAAGGGAEFVCVRFGNVLGSNGSVVPIFRRQIESGGPVTVTHPEITRYFMTIPEASRLVLQAACMARGGEIFILDMGEAVKILDLARNMIRIAGLVPDVDIKIVFTGLRPGEKLYEELLIDTSEAQRTDNDRIFVAHPAPDPQTALDAMLRSLKEHSDNPAYDEEGFKKFIGELEPTFKPEAGKGRA